jgi:hypothetical protein
MLGAMGTTAKPQPGQIWATQNLPLGGSVQINVTSQVCSRAAAVAVLEAITAAITGPGGPHAGKTMCLIQQWGNDQNQPGMPFASPQQPSETSLAFTWTFPAGQLERVFDVWTTDGALVFSIIAFALANEATTGGKGKWIYAPIPGPAGAMGFKSLQWIGDPAVVPAINNASMIAFAQSQIAFYTRELQALSPPA